MYLILTHTTAELILGKAAVLVSLSYHYFGVLTSHGQLVKLVTW